MKKNNLKYQTMRTSVQNIMCVIRLKDKIKNTAV